VLPSLPIVDMLCGAVAMINIMMAVRDRAQDGHSDYENPFLTATDCEQVDEGFRLYSPEVQKIQNAPHLWDNDIQPSRQRSALRCFLCLGEDK
jgi:hypothetical protein